MAAARLSDLKSVRRALGKSQSEISELLGVSTRAVQSYEQGWRPTPVRVQQMAGLLLYLDWRKDGNNSAPCWKVQRCRPEKKAKCPAYQYKAGDLCWLIAGTHCRGIEQRSSEAKMVKCRRCPAMKEWLPE